MRFCIFGKGLYDPIPRKLTPCYRSLAGARRRLRGLRWEGYRELRVRRMPAAARMRPRGISAQASHSRRESRTS